MTLKEQLELIDAYGINFEDNEIYLSGLVESNWAIILRLKIKQLRMYNSSNSKNLERIKIFLDSPGGDISCLVGIYDLFQQLKSENILIDIQAESNCMSAATLILASATGKKTAGKSCRFMVHELQLENISGSKSQTNSFNKELNHIHETFLNWYSFLAKEDFTEAQLKKERNKWSKLCNAETYFSTQDALRLKLIDEIVV
jgi:ATP-dependent protease ClpP protease subunit